jgi:hypothetical protein
MTIREHLMSLGHIHGPICFGIGLHITLDKSYSNLYEHEIIYISLDGRTLDYRWLGGGGRKNGWTKKNSWKFCLFIIRLTNKPVRCNGRKKINIRRK